MQPLGLPKGENDEFQFGGNRLSTQHTGLTLWETDFLELRLCSAVAPGRPSAYSCVNSSPTLIS